MCFSNRVLNGSKTRVPSQHPDSAVSRVTISPFLPPTCMATWSNYMLSEWNKGPYEKDLAPSTGQPLMLPSLPGAPPWQGGPAHPALLRPALSLLQSIKFSTKLRASAEREKRTLPARDHLTADPSAPTPSPCQLEASHRQESTAVRCLQHTVPHVSRGAKNFQTPRLPSRVHNLSPSMHASHPSSPV